MECGFEIINESLISKDQSLQFFWTFASQLFEKLKKVSQKLLTFSSFLQNQQQLN